MRYVRPHYYEEFVCAADKCPATCCAGWQIAIDEDSLKRYAKEGGAFGNRLCNSIDWEEGVFYQYDRRCSFLNEENLCDIYGELGAEALCDTCRMYPRHTEEYEGLRELSLSLSCPVAAERMLGCTEKVRFLESFTDEEEEFEEFDFLMFTQLEEAREVIFHILQNRSLDSKTRMATVEKLAREFQECVDEGRSFEIDERIARYESAYGTERQEEVSLHPKTDWQAQYARRLEELALLEGLERLRPEWTKLLRQTRRLLYGQGAQAYADICREFYAALHENSLRREASLRREVSLCHEAGEKDALDYAAWESIAEQLMMFFTYTYFCGSVYDDMVYAKMALALFSTEWIQELCIVRWLEKGRELTFADIVEIAWRFAREVEHSDENLNALEEASCHEA